MQLTAVVEGQADETIVRRLAQLAGFLECKIYGREGKGFIKARRAKYSQAASFHAPYLILVDLDRDADCAPQFLRNWAVGSKPHLVFAVAVRTIETWVMADQKKFAQFFGVPEGKVPSRPEELVNPKLELINLARGSTKREIKQGIVPMNSSAREGPLYNTLIGEFVDGGGWRPDFAAKSSPSLERTIRRLKEMRLQV